MIKALFITHDISIYGASRSLQTLLRNYSKDEVTIDLMINRRLLGENDIPGVRRKFGNYIRNVYQRYLPFELCEVGKPKPNLGLLLKNMLYKLNRKALLQWIGQQGYDVVYLNSLVMHSLISGDLPFIIHVREIYDFSQQSVYSSLRNARGIIFIDESTQKPFLKESYKHSIVLNNPFDMKPPQGNLEDGMAKLAHEKRTVISMIGKIKESKGNLFVLQAFLRSSMAEHGVLIFIGNADEAAYFEKCKAATKQSANVIFHGEEGSIEKIYHVSDFIVRGEGYPCIGRTIFEGLYSGCHAIIPGSPQDFSDTFEASLKDRIHYYEPRNLTALSALLDSLTGTKVVERKYQSNAPQYVEHFHSFLKKVINHSKL